MNKSSRLSMWKMSIMSALNTLNIDVIKRIFNLKRKGAF
jgi:hypothetical protein